MGMPVAKNFDTELFRGHITSINVDNNGLKLYHITYDGGHEEDMHYEECSECIKKASSDSSEGNRVVCNRTLM